MRKGPRRYSGKRKLTQNKVYTIQREAEVMLYNDDPATGGPGVFSTDFPYLGIGSNDATAFGLPNSSNFGIQFNDCLLRLSGVTEFTNLFEYYRITNITRTWVPIYASTPNTAGYYHDKTAPLDDSTATVGFTLPTLMVLADYDSNEPVTAAQARERQGIRRVKMTHRFTESFSPKPSMPVGQTTAGPAVFSVVPKRSPWISTEATNIEFYGRRYGVLDWPGPNNGVGTEGDAVPCAWRIYSRYTVQFKGVK